MVLLVPTAYYRLKNLFKRKEKSQTVYLTFDDGPSKEYTQKLLSLLRRYGIKATFFVIGETALENKEIISEMVRDGHTIGFHGMTHTNQILKGYSKCKREFEEGIAVFKSMELGPTLYRPTWGCFGVFTSYFADIYGFSVLLWDIMIGDWKKKDSRVLKDDLINKVKGGEVICLHDGRGEEGAPGKMIEALEVAIPNLLKRGFKFEGLEYGR